MNYYNIPERPLEPPEDKRAVVCRCIICEGEIREHDDYYNIPDLGPCCEECIEESKCYDAELEHPTREEDF